MCLCDAAFKQAKKNHVKKRMRTSPNTKMLCIIVPFALRCSAFGCARVCTVFARFILRCNCTSFCWLYVFSILRFRLLCPFRLSPPMPSYNVCTTILVALFIFIYLRFSLVLHYSSIYSSIIWCQRPHVHGPLHHPKYGDRRRYNNHFRWQIVCVPSE